MTIGEVAEDVWTHLAMVVDGEKGSVWLNGKKTGIFNPTKAIASNFSIAVSEEGKDALMVKYMRSDIVRLPQGSLTLTLIFYWITRR